MGRYLVGWASPFRIDHTLRALSLLLTANSWWAQPLIGFVCANTWIILFSQCQTMLQKGKNMSKLEKNQKMSNEEGWSPCALSFDFFPELRNCRRTQTGKINSFPSKYLSSQGIQVWLQAYVHARTHMRTHTCTHASIPPVERRQFPMKLLLKSH